MESSKLNIGSHEYSSGAAISNVVDASGTTSSPALLAFCFGLAVECSLPGNSGSVWGMGCPTHNIGHKFRDIPSQHNRCK